jgi:hypothetical protein
MEYLPDGTMTADGNGYTLLARLSVTQKDLIDYCRQRLAASKFSVLLQILARGVHPADSQPCSKPTADR